MSGLLGNIHPAAAEFVTVAIRSARRSAVRADIFVHDQVADIEHVFREIASEGLPASNGQERSAAVTAQSVLDDEFDDQREWLSVEDAVRMTPLSESTIRRRIRDGQIRSQLIGRRRLIARADLLSPPGPAAAVAPGGGAAGTVDANRQEARRAA